MSATNRLTCPNRVVIVAVLPVGWGVTSPWAAYRFDAMQRSVCSAWRSSVTTSGTVLKVRHTILIISDGGSDVLNECQLSRDHGCSVGRLRRVQRADEPIAVDGHIAAAQRWNGAAVVRRLAPLPDHIPRVPLFDDETICIELQHRRACEGGLVVSSRRSTHHVRRTARRSDPHRAVPIRLAMCQPSVVPRHRGSCALLIRCHTYLVRHCDGPIETATWPSPAAMVSDERRWLTVAYPDNLRSRHETLRQPRYPRVLVAAQRCSCPATPERSPSLLASIRSRRNRVTHPLERTRDLKVNRHAARLPITLGE